MAGGVHASSPGSATVTHQMGHSVLRSEYSLHLNGETSTTRKRKSSSDAAYQLDSKRKRIYNHVLPDMIIEKEKFTYISLLDEYEGGDENDFIDFVDKNYPETELPFFNPHQPNPKFLSDEPDHLKDYLANASKDIKVKQEPSESKRSSRRTDYNSKAYSPIVLLKPLSGPVNHVADNNSQQIAAKAKQEAYVLQRVAELQKNGLWTEKRLTKVQEPPRTKAHWDYVLEEMEWLANEFAQERKWKKTAARKRSRMVQKHFQEREALVLKAAKAVELHKRRIASHLGKMVKLFWSNVEKLVDFKQQTKLKEKRQQALDQHLSFIVDKTERYSSLVAESMNKSALSYIQDNSRSHSPDENSDAEFEPNQSSSDDEETIEAEERVRGSNVDHGKEIEMLKRESELPLEDLLNELPAEYLKNIDIATPECSKSTDGGGPSSDEKHMDDDDEYKMEADESDDESTLLEEEKRQGKVDYKSEIAELEADNNLSIDELMKKYSAEEPRAGTSSSTLPSSRSDSSSPESTADEESNADSDDENESTVDNTDDEEDEEDDEDDEENSDDDDGSDGLMSLLKDSTLENGDMNEENTDEKIDDVAAIAESIQPKGNTLSSTSVVTKVPFLLKHSLREYQHIGLDWLVTMYERKLNGILADEMGLGKTIQTIALLAHLASDKEDWGPHLIIVPTSVMLNWEMEFKKWCPAFKILTYYGNPKERKLKRSGWTKPNTFHVCITSYKLVLQDHHCFRRKKWKYLILDEAQNIKNFKSQRWQRLLNFDSERRLLLTGTPLQNNLMELWSLMHFLMPNLFASHHEFKEWFSNPVTGMIEGNAEYNENIIKRLHKVLRPFLLRRLKTEVEKQLPSKYEHVVMCRLSNRQRYLYDDFMSRAKTKETLSCGNLLSVINVLMQLRKVCNHPNLFEARPIISPFQMDSLHYHTASLVYGALDYSPFEHVSLESLNLRIANVEEKLTAWSVYRAKKLRYPRKLIEEVDVAPEEAPALPRISVNVHSKVQAIKTEPSCNLGTVKLNNTVAKRDSKITSYFKTSPQTVTGEVPKMTIYRNVVSSDDANNLAVKQTKPSDGLNYTFQLKATKLNAITPAKICFTPAGSKIPIQATVLKNVIPTTSVGGVAKTMAVANMANMANATGAKVKLNSASQPQIIQAGAGKQTFILNASVAKAILPTTTMTTSTGQRIILTNISASDLKAPVIKLPQLQQTILNNATNLVVNNTIKSSVSIPKPISTPTKASSSQFNPPATSSSSGISSTSGITTRSKIENKSKEEVSLEDPTVTAKRKAIRKQKLRILGTTNDRKTDAYVMYGHDVRDTLTLPDTEAGITRACRLASASQPNPDDGRYWKCAGHANCVNAQYAKHVYSMCYTLTNALCDSVKSIEERIQELSETFSRFIVYVPAVNARRASLHVAHPNPSKSWNQRCDENVLEKVLAPKALCLHQVVSKMTTAFPDSRLIQYDCGKLQTLDTLLRRLKAGQHRVLIFTQMARMLDVLETFLTFHGHIYLRLDGSTRIDQRQVLMERFNADKRYFVFILSTRSGGIGVNLTGADTVIFYDSDWNPTMDAQAQDRCHRIGQTRDVHIYRLISERTVEENILKKANQKKLLGDLAIEGGNFTTAYFKSTTIHDLFNVDFNESDPAKRMSDMASEANASQSGVEKSTLNAYENALAAAEDETDVNAAKTAKEEAVAELEEFDENIPLVDNDNADISANLPTEAEQKVNALLEQLTPIERWALQFMETVDAEWAEEQLAAAEAEIEQQKKEWEMERLAIEQADERSKRRRFLEDMEPDEDSAPNVTHIGNDSKSQTADTPHSRLRSKKDKPKRTNCRRSVNQENETRRRSVANTSRVSV